MPNITTNHAITYCITCTNYQFWWRDSENKVYEKAQTLKELEVSLYSKKVEKKPE